MCSCDPVKNMLKVFVSSMSNMKKTFILTVIGAQNAVDRVIHPTEIFSKKTVFPAGYVGVGLMFFCFRFPEMLPEGTRPARFVALTL